jgi:hypothetical protein
MSSTRRPPTWTKKKTAFPKGIPRTGSEMPRQFIRRGRRCQEFKGPRCELGVDVNGMRKEGADVHKGSICEAPAVPHAELAERAKVRKGVARHTAAAVEVQDHEAAS